jgi:hypothetical protein
LDLVFDLIKKQNITPTAIQNNEFGERCFVFKGTDGTSWQIIEKKNATKNVPVTKVEMKLINE